VTVKSTDAESLRRRTRSCSARTVDAPGALLDGDLDAGQLAAVAPRALDRVDRHLVARPAGDDDVARDIGDADAPSRPILTLRENRSVCSAPALRPWYARTVAVRTTSRRTTGLSGSCAPAGTAAIATPAITNDSVSRMVSYLLS
jgi:hypothetical protein